VTSDEVAADRPGGAATVALVEEQLSVRRERVETGRVRLHVVTDEEVHQLREELRTESLEVERIAIGRELAAGEAPPAPREEEGGDVLILPVVEEVLVVEKRLLLKEELRIRRRVATDRVDQPVTLRRQRAEIERLPPEPAPTPGRSGKE
jgi:uncharacterized protein (TIGR02271 family)